MPDAETAVQHIAVEDIGAFARLVFERPDAFLGEALELAGDTLTASEIARAIGVSTGRNVVYHQYPPEAINQDPVLSALLDFLRHKGFAANIPLLRSLHPGLLTFDRWLDRGAKRRFGAVLAA